MGVIAHREMKGAANVEAEMARRQEELSSNEREIQSKRRLIASLATQNVGSAARGVEAYTGSPLAQITETYRVGEKEELTGRVMKAHTMAGIEQRRINVRKRADIQLGQSLIQDATSMAKRGTGTKPGAKTKAS
jgi:hypothetical protein